MYCPYCHALLTPELSALHAGYCCDEHRELQAEVLKRRQTLAVETAKAKPKELKKVLDFPEGCPVCGKSIPLMAKLRGSRFCSPEHEEEHKQVAEAEISERLTRHAEGGAGSGAMGTGRRTKLRRPHPSNGSVTPPLIPLPKRSAEWTVGPAGLPDVSPLRRAVAVVQIGSPHVEAINTRADGPAWSSSEKTESAATDES